MHCVDPQPAARPRQQQDREVPPTHLCSGAVLWRIDQHQQAARLVGIAKAQGAVDGCCSSARRPAAATTTTGAHSVGHARDVAQHTSLAQPLQQAAAGPACCCRHIA